MTTTNSSESIISSPKGGGALKGIGETFAPDLFTGTGNFTIPISIPPGRNGFQPSLSLVYSTGNGNGPFGLGWNLSIPGVGRKTSKGIPRYQDYDRDLNNRDTFILSGAEDLVPVEEISDNITRYRPRTEGLFALIDHHHAPGNNFWEVRSKDGLRSFYGTRRPEDAVDEWIDPAIVTAPSDSTKIFNWNLSRTLDPFGNQIVYEYERDSTEEGPRFWDQLYLRQIKYIDYSTGGGETEFLVTVTFHYEERPDPFSDYRAGFEIRTRRRCTHIEVHTHPDETFKVRTYQLIYLDQRTDIEAQLPINGVSLLSRVKVIGHDRENSEELPPLQFGYSQFEPEGRDFFPLEGRDLPAQSLGNPNTEMVDLFGNGLPDILQMNGSVRYWRNLGNGRFDLPREMRDAPGGLQLGDAGVQLLDADGDGRADLMVSSTGLSGYFPLRFGGFWDRRSFKRYDFAPSFDLQDPEVRLMDLTGDGVTDVIRSGSSLELFYQDPQLGWNGARRVARRRLEDFPNVNFSDPRIKFADMSGDGLQDIVWVYDGNIEYWPNLGYGNWAKRIHMHNSPRFPYDYDPRRILIGDVDGDGLADIVYVDHCRVLLWINQSGNAWSGPIEIDGTPDVTDFDAVRLADMLGSGVAGVLWTRDAAAPGRETLFFLDFTGGKKPYLLHEMDNHLGAVTRVQYTPSTKFYLQDQEQLETRWKTPLPFPVLVVSSVEVIDQISGGKLTTEYFYHHGYWDGAEREFRGFGRVDQRDTEVFDNFNTDGLHGGQTFNQVEGGMFSPPTESRTWFHQGPVGDEFGDWGEVDYRNEYWAGDLSILERSAEMNEFLRAFSRRRIKRDALRTLRGNILRTELYALDGSELAERPYTVTESQYEVREESIPTDGDSGRLHIFFPHSVAQRTTQWERGNDPMTGFSFTEDYDEYGQARRQTQIACPRGWRNMADIAGEPFFGTRNITAFARSIDTGNYIVDRAAKATSYEIINDGSRPVLGLKDLPDDSPDLRIIGQALNFYDGDAFVGLPFGEIENFGALVRTESLVLTEDILQEVYAGEDTELFPPYLFPGDAPPTWPAEYPEAFRDNLPEKAGYVFQSGGGGSPYARGYFVVAQRRRYDFQTPDTASRGLVMAARSPLGSDSDPRDTNITYEAYDLLPETVTDPIGLTTSARYNYQLFQPRQVTDSNGNRSVITYSPLGLPLSTAVMGKAGELVGDTMEVPGTRLIYDFAAFMDRGEPVSVRTILREHHVNELDVPLPDRNNTIESIEYSDGFGRLLQTRSQAEDVTFGNPVFGGELLPAGQGEALPSLIGGRMRAAGDPVNVRVSGWQIYNNKGWVVQKYEPFFSTDWDYQEPIEEERGQCVTMFYDPRGQVLRTLNPDGSEQRVIFGIPRDINEPDDFIPTPWEGYTYDANDNAGRTHPEGSPNYQHHWNTPANIRVDALGRTIEAVERNRRRLSEGVWTDVEEYHTRSSYDIRGNLLTVTDALGRLNFQYFYDLANNPLRTENIDAGIRRTILDAAGNVAEGRDSKGALILRSYDRANRPVRLFARDGAGELLTLREYLVYGDNTAAGISREEALEANLLGNLYRYYDEAGLQTFDVYDFKGNLLEKARRVISNREISRVFETPLEDNRYAAYLVNWQAPDGMSLAAHAENILDTRAYQITFSYDALNRIKSQQYPEDEDGERKILRPNFNRAGSLERVILDGNTYVEHIAYNAKGQRSLIAYGNQVLTTYAYDVETFRLNRLRTERYRLEGSSTYLRTNLNVPIQDFAYSYDLIGNIMDITDRTPGCGVLNNPDTLRYPDLSGLLVAGDALVRRFEYDPLYRLVQATGRECRSIPSPRPWSDDQRCGYNSGRQGTPTQDNAPRMTDSYRELYRYDPAGNMLSMGHYNNGRSWTRHFGMGGMTPDRWDSEWQARLGGDTWTDAPGNRLTHVGDDAPTTPQSHFFDVNGNMVRETTTRHFEWDFSDRLKVFRNQVVGREPTIHAQYLYDAAGQRVKKLVRRAGGNLDMTVYIDGIFEHDLWVRGTVAVENNHLHITDSQQRIAIVRTGAAFPDNSTPEIRIKYHLGDHLGSSNLVVDDGGAWINREEFTPYGETSLGSFGKKRYRFTGMERDEESGLNYHFSRYYVSWLNRWINPDPIGLIGGLNLFEFVLSNPLKFTDPSGLTPMIPYPEGGGSGEVLPDNISPEEALAGQSFDPNGSIDYDSTAYSPHASSSPTSQNNQTPQPDLQREQLDTYSSPPAGVVGFQSGGHPGTRVPANPPRPFVQRPGFGASGPTATQAPPPPPARVVGFQSGGHPGTRVPANPPRPFVQRPGFGASGPTATQAPPHPPARVVGFQSGGHPGTRVPANPPRPFVQRPGFGASLPSPTPIPQNPPARTIGFQTSSIETTPTPGRLPQAGRQVGRALTVGAIATASTHEDVWEILFWGLALRNKTVATIVGFGILLPHD